MERPNEASPETVQNQSEDMDFEASHPNKLNDSLGDFDPLKAKPESLDLPADECKISVEGMTCQSCVRTIEGKMIEVPGIISIKVSLSEKMAYVKYRADLTSPQQIADQIDDMGFETAITEAEKPSIEKNLKRVTVVVKGMTCNSCVQNIEGVIGDRPDVVSIKVTIVQVFTETLMSFSGLSFFHD